MDITSALATVKAVSELTSSILGGVIDEKVKAKAQELNSSIITLQSTIFEIQTNNQELFEINKGLKQGLVDASNWENEAKRYHLVQFGPGSFVYALKSDEQGSDPIHSICPNCYQKNKKSILQFSMRSGKGTTYVCHDCDSSFIDRNDSFSYAEIL